MLPLDVRDLRLLDRWQRGLPLVPAPFAALAEHEGRNEGEILAALRRLQQVGVLSRVGAVVRPNTVGCSLLAAMQVPERDLERVAGIVNAEPAINHNYEREHAFNLWFVVTAPDLTERDATLARLRSRTGLDVLELPLLESYYIDLGFALRASPTVKSKAIMENIGRGALEQPSGEDCRLIAALENGLPLVARPFAAVGTAVGMDEAAVIARLGHLIECGIVTRFGCVVRHRQLGFTANAMAVWDVPDQDAARVGTLLAAVPCVTLCYRRPRRLPDWPYNLFCMVHGRERAAVEAEVGHLTELAELTPRARAVLFSRRCFRQRGARFQRNEARARR